MQPLRTPLEPRGPGAWCLPRVPLLIKTYLEVRHTVRRVLGAPRPRSLLLTCLDVRQEAVAGYRQMLHHLDEFAHRARKRSFSSPIGLVGTLLNTERKVQGAATPDGVKQRL
jgi:hypothetical protein